MQARIVTSTPHSAALRVAGVTGAALVALLAVTVFVRPEMVMGVLHAMMQAMH